MTEIRKNLNQAEHTAAAESCDLTICLLNSINIEGLNKDNLSVMLIRVLDVIVDYFEADHGYITLNNKDDQDNNLASVNRLDPDDTQISTSKAVTKRVLETSKGIAIFDVFGNNDFAGDPQLQRFNVTSLMCSPIKTDDSAFGFIYIDSTKGDCKWNESQTQLLGFLANHIALAVDNIVNSVKESSENKRLIAAGNATLKLSHSVKNILQMVGGAAEVIDFGLKTNQIHRVKKSWDILKPNLERLKKFTLDMLDYSKERKLEIGPCDFNRVIQGSIESLKSQLKQKNSKLNIRVDPKMPTVKLDGERIHEMSLNLILNAIDIVDENTGVVSVEAKYLSPQKEILLSITDNGPGISDEMKTKIFTPFESDKNKFGTGLGMPIAKQIVDQHNGRIEIDSEPNKGTTFNIFLPATVTE